MKIGTKIRELRRKRGMTQEQLSEYLNVSYQAVSKWENGTAYPDITLIPVIASVFGVSTDCLFGLNDNIENERTKELREEYTRLCMKGDNIGRVKIMRDALAEFPNNYEFMDCLARSIFRTAEDKSSIDEAVAICKKILNGCGDEMIRCSAIQTLSRLYSCTGERELAVKFAQKLPPIRYSREYALECALYGEERNYQIQLNAFELLLDVSSKLLTRAGKGAGRRAFYEEEISAEDELYIYEKTEIILKSLFDDGNYGVISGKLAQLCRFRARCYANSGEYGKAMEQLLMSEKYADIFENNKNKGKKYTTPFFDRLKIEFYGTRHGDSSEYGRILRKIRQWDCFDSIRNTEEFMEFEKRIEKKAQELEQGTEHRT